MTQFKDRFTERLYRGDTKIGQLSVELSAESMHEDYDEAVKIAFDHIREVAREQMKESE